jgi:hypothetical protein
MADQPREFGRRLPVLPPPAPVKRSHHVALLLTGTVAIGGGAYAMMPAEHCVPNQAGAAATPVTAGACSRSGSWSFGGGHGYWGGRSSGLSFFGGDASSGGAAPNGTGQVTRGGFGSFARTVAGHFSGS